MCPCGVVTAEEGGGDDRGDGPGEDGVRKEPEEEVRDRVGDEAVKSKDVKTTEAREEAGAGAKVFDGCAELGSYGFGLDDEDLLLDQRSGLFLGGERSVRVVFELSSWGCVDDDCGSWAFDHGEGGDHLTISVADLEGVSRSSRSLPTKFCGDTYRASNHEEENSRQPQYHESPCWQLEHKGLLMALCDIHTAAHQVVKSG